MQYLKIDRSYWRTHDVDWVAQRENDWLVFEKWLRVRYEDEDFGVEAAVEVIKVYYFTGKLQKSYFNWDVSLILHPESSVNVLRKVIQIGVEPGYYPLDGRYIRGFPVFKNLLGPFIEKGVMSYEKAVNIILAVCGENYGEMAVLRGFNPNDQVHSESGMLFSDFGSWLLYGSVEEYPVDLLVSHVKSFVKHISDENLEAISFRLNRLTRRLSKPLNQSDSNLEFKTQIANDMKAFLLSDEVHSCVNDVAKEYF